MSPNEAYTAGLGTSGGCLSPAGIRAEANSKWGDETTEIYSLQTGPLWEDVERARILELQKMAQQARGRKDDFGKSRVDLIDAEFLEGLGDVLRFGAAKYNPYNYRNGIRYSRVLGSIFRHLLALLRGEDLDKESGLGHVFHLAGGVMFLSFMLKHRPDLDDRAHNSGNNPTRLGLVNLAPCQTQDTSAGMLGKSNH